MQQPDLSSLQAFLNASMSTDPLVVQPDDADTQGMSFADLFSHYLAPEVAKLPASSTSSSSLATPASDAFTASLPAFASGSASAASSTFDPSTFLPSTMPGSPFSPESDDQRSSSSTNGGAHDRSPVSLAELDFSTAPVLSGSSEGFAIDPSVFDAPATFEGFDAESILALPELAAPSSASDAATQMTSAVLPPLPALPAAVAAPPAPVAATAPTTTSATGRPKRSIVHSVIREQPEEEDEHDDDDDNMYSFDASSNAGPSHGRTTSAAARTSRTRRPTKKVRSASPSVSISGTATGDEDQPSATAAAAAARKLARTSVVPLASSTLHKTAANSHLPPVPMWADKPDPKEYAKLSSKEKRQLRNKISARNFRHRRKEYITTLEEEISTRDTLISELQDEVGVIRAENSGLRTEVATLREQWQNLLDKLSSMTTPPAAGTVATGLGTNPPRVVASSAAAAGTVKQEDSAEAVIMPESTSTRRIGTRSSSGIQVPNLSKDVAPLSRRSGANSTWGAFGAGASAGSFMSVHTTLVPDVNFTNLADGLHGKPSAAVVATMPFSNQSFNPAMNALTQSQLAALPAMTAHTRTGLSAAAGNTNNGTTPQQQQQSSATFQDLFASNPFYLRPDALDQSRAALYGKLANNAAGLIAAQKQAGEHAQGQNIEQPQRDERGYLPIPNGFRPAFFTSPKASSSSTTASELLAFQSPAAAAAAASSTIPSAPTLSHQDAVELRQQATMAHVAQLANQTLVQRLASSFWDAFVGPSPVAAVAGGGPAAKSLDVEKVKAVLLGQARVQVVPNSPTVAATPLSPTSASSGLDQLERQMGALSVGGENGSRTASPERCSFAQVGRRWLTGEKRA
ncbi:hypothetical protein JCM10908_007184 [Rhodotorula pacifica]|uniref:bZIP transcription factor n=1 Tax=Rhodotorula pacifica TaxID=1495444 RepID=UPI003177E5C0